MSPPSRRELLDSLGTAAVVGVGTAGCLGDGDPSGPATDGVSPAMTTSNTGPTPTDVADPEPVGIDVRSELDAAARLTVTVAGTSGRVSKHVTEVHPGDRVILDSGIDDVGEYTIAVDATDGPAGETTVGIDDYDLENGSNIIVSVGSEGVRFLIQE